MRILLVGDSQANGSPGRTAELRLRELGHTTQRVAMDGHGPIAYLNNTDNVWNAYISAVRTFNPDIILTIWGHNPTNEAAIRRIKDAVRQPVYASGPPHYAGPSDQAIAERFRETYKRVFGDSRYIDAMGWTGPEVARTPDGFHFTATSGAAWGRPLAEELDRRLRAGPLASGPADGVDRRGPRSDSGPGHRNHVVDHAKKPHGSKP